MNRRTFIGTSLGAGFALANSGCILTKPREFVYPESPEFNELQRELEERDLTITDYHIHIRGGMTPQKAIQREKCNGIKSAVLENFGREWPLKTSRDLDAFISICRKVKTSGTPLPVGIQVNDRDWHRQIDKTTFQRLDYVLADTMIMGTTSEGKPRRLWKDGVVIDRPETWMQDYMHHNLGVLDEPVTILANPTYLPKCIAHLYDKLWTDERMEKLIAKAIEKKVAVEIQLETKFARERFLRKAHEMGAIFSFGSNNFTDKTKDVSNWLRAIQLLDLSQKDILTTPKKLVYPG